jgi:hypothetical protein
MKQKTEKKDPPILLSTKEAVNLAASYGIKISIDSMRVWCHKKGIATKVSGVWYVKKDKLLSFLKLEELND